MDAFSKRLKDIVSDSILSLGLALGYELQLFDAIAAVSSKEKPATSNEIAAKANMKERYVHEWLCMMACGDIIEVDETGKKFWIGADKVSELCGEKPSAMLVLQTHAYMLAKAYPMVQKLFNKDGPLGLQYSVYEDFDKRMSSLSETEHQAEMISKFVPLTGMKDKLEVGLNVLDVGCGRGIQISELAKYYPKSTFIGIDFKKDTIDDAKKRLGEKGIKLDNLSFIEMNAQKITDEWSDKFDWVTIFDACHDQTRPDLCLKEIYRVLKKDGLFSMIEVDGTSNVYDDKSNESALFGYGVSLFHCLPVASNSEDALCLGTMWGKKKAKELLNDAGFQNIRIEPSPFSNDNFNILYLCRK